jgi:hypothetical protein
MSEPEHIGSILKRVFEELERQYGKNLGAQSTDSCGVDALTIDPGAPSLSGREAEDANRLDKALQKTP